MGLDMMLNAKGKHRAYYEAMYWRKVNAIHQWFVENVQDNADDCEEYPVSREQLTTLLELCELVANNPNEASNVLPTQEGFFFGGTEYDEWYFDNIKRTVEELRALLNDVEVDTFVYQSSW